MFSGLSYPVRLAGKLYDQTGSGKSKMVASKPEVLKSQTACRHDRNTILKAISMFLRFSYPIGHSRILYDQTVSRKFKMAASKP